MVSRRHFLTAVGGAAVLVGSGLLNPLQAAEAAPFSLAALGQGTDGETIRRSLGLRDGLIYLNAGTLGPIPQYTRDAVFEAWRRLEENPADEGFGPLLQSMEEARKKAAAYLGCAVEELAVTQSTTDSMNAIAQGINLQKGDHVLTTDHEHPGGRLCWDYYARKAGVVVDAVPLPMPPKTAGEIVDAFAQKLTDATRVISVSHVTYTTGLKLPVAGLADLARAHGALLVVDGAQAPGGMRVDVKALKCHAYAASPHKWMLAPKGTGLLYISAEARKQIDPLVLQSGMSCYTGATGTRNLPGIIGLGAAVELLTAVGKDAIEQRTMALRNRLYEEAGNIPGVTVVSPAPGELAAPLITLDLPDNVNNYAFATRLKERGIIVRSMDGHGINGIRVSPHIYTREEDIAALVNAVREELA
ncbi:MAG: aminotransferase class V-fold PLP-dependent enzyme [Armatimonadota bacterium]